MVLFDHEICCKILVFIGLRMYNFFKTQFLWMIHFENNVNKFVLNIFLRKCSKIILVVRKNVVGSRNGRRVNIPKIWKVSSSTFLNELVIERVKRIWIFVVSFCFKKFVGRYFVGYTFYKTEFSSVSKIMVLVERSARHTCTYAHVKHLLNKNIDLIIWNLIMVSKINKLQFYDTT